MAGNDVINILASEGYSLPTESSGEDGNKFGEIRRAKRSGRDRANHDIIFWYHRTAASIGCIQTPSLCSGSPD